MTTKSDSVTRVLGGNAPLLLNNFFAEKEDKVRIYSIDASRVTTIVGRKGARFSFQPDCFSDALGNPVTGEVQIHLREVFQKGEMVLSNRMATSEDRLLEAAGQFFLFATQNHHPLELREPITVEVPVHQSLTNPVAIRLFAGSSSSILPFNPNPIFDWKLVVDKPLKIRKISGKKYFHFEIEAFNWYGCQYFYAKKTVRTMVSARSVADVESFDDQAAFLVFKDIHSVARMYLHGNRFTAFNIPVNLSAYALIIALKDRQLHFGLRIIDQISSQLVPVKLEPVSEDQLLETLRNL